MKNLKWAGGLSTEPGNNICLLDSLLLIGRESENPGKRTILKKNVSNRNHHDYNTIYVIIQ